MVVAIYRLPNATQDFFTHFENLVRAIENENKEIDILGGLNCDLIMLNSDHAKKKRKSRFEVYQLTLLIDEATRISSISSTQFYYK